MAKSGAEYLNSHSKRLVDVLGALVVALEASPALIPAAVLAGIDNRSLRPFFRQARMGQNDQQIEITKFRTIREERARGELKIYGPYDPRATKIGSFLRGFGWDELPQLYQVLSGELSLVGHRPHLTNKVWLEAAPDIYEEWHEVCSPIKPGLINPSNFLLRRAGRLTDEVVARVMQAEINYVKEQASVREDLKIIGLAPFRLARAIHARAQSEASLSYV